MSENPGIEPSEEASAKPAKKKSWLGRTLAAAAAIGFVAVAMNQCEGEQREVPPPAPVPEDIPEPVYPALAEGFYKVAEKTMFYDRVDNKAQPVLNLTEGTCVEVIDGLEGFEVAKIDIEKFHGYVIKTGLVSAPECAEPRSTESIVPQESATGNSFTLSSFNFLFTSPENPRSAGSIPPGTCVTVEEERVEGGWMRLSATTNKGPVSGWAVDVVIGTPCQP